MLLLFLLYDCITSTNVYYLIVTLVYVSSDVSKNKLKL